MGKRATRILLDRIAQQTSEDPNPPDLTAEVVMQPELVIRESTGPAPA